MATKRIVYTSTIKNWMKVNSSLSFLIVGMIALLALRGDITILNYSGDYRCKGTIDNPCVANITFKANVEIYIQPIPENDTKWMAFETYPAIKSVEVYRTWGNSWRKIPFNASYHFVKGQTYTLEFRVLKNNPQDKIKWSFTKDADPYFLPTICELINDKPIYVNVTAWRDKNVLCKLNNTITTCLNLSGINTDCSNTVYYYDSMCISGTEKYYYSYILEYTKLKKCELNDWICWSNSTYKLCKYRLDSNGVNDKCRDGETCYEENGGTKETLIYQGARPLPKEEMETEAGKI